MPMVQVIIQHQIANFILDNPNKNVNVINRDFTQALQEAITLVKTNDGVKGVIITSAKKTFMAGGDLDNMFAIRHNPNDIFKSCEHIKFVLRQLETLGKPVVAAISGSALGGGLELALACHYRIALADSNLQIGFPEVTLGLLPGAGGIVRTVRLLGLQAALPYLTEGKKVSAADALADGLIHALAATPDDIYQKATIWIEQNPQAKAPWDSDKNFKIPNGDPRNPKIAQLLAIAPAMLFQKTQGNYPAPQAILNCAVEGAMVDFDTASRIESRYFAQLLSSQVAENMITAFWSQLNSINAGKSRPATIPQQFTKKLGVLGAGMMGAGIAYVSALAGIEVVLKDVSIEKAELGKQYSVQLLDKAVARRKMTAEQRDAVLQRIKTTDHAADLSDCDLVIEAVFEKRELKAAVTHETEAYIAPTAIFGSNTSTLPITGLATQSVRPENFIGIHFFSPVDKMQLVEIIIGEKTTETTLARTFDYVRQIKKTPIVVNDSRGFYTSRVFGTYVMEGAALLLEGQNPRAIETAGLKAGMPVGPLALMDEVSLALSYDVREQTRRDFAAANLPYEEHPGQEVLGKMVVDLQRSGKKAGKGFYDYPTAGKKHLWEGLSTYFPPSPAPLSQQDIIDRLLFAQALETVRCLEEGVLNHVADANIGSIFGWGFAPFYGGTLQFINSYGLRRFYDRSIALAQRFGKRFSPPKLLQTMLENNQLFTSDFAVSTTL